MNCTLIFLATTVLLLSVEINALGKCRKAVAKFDRRMLGAFKPRCKPDGSYEEKQCHGSTGHCWCVEPSTGKEIRGTRKGPGKGETTCALGKCRKAVAKSDRRMLGAFKPRCKPDGSYEEKQCHGSTGHCWCVEPSTGKEILGTRKGPGKGETTCAGYCLHKGRKYLKGQRITIRCNSCFCAVGRGRRGGSFACTRVACPPRPLIQCRCALRLTCLDGQKLLVTPASKAAICSCPTYRCIGAPVKSVKCVCPKIRCADARTVPNGTYKLDGCTCTKYKCVGYRLSCLHNKKRYSVGQSFKSTEGCGSSCTCTRRGFGYASFVCLHRRCMPTGISKGVTVDQNA